MDMQALLLQLVIIAAPAIMANACAVMENSAALRYQLAIPQWREFRASIAAKDEQLAALYADPDSALNLSERRIRLLLRGLNLLHVAVAVFGFTSFFGVLGAVASPNPWIARGLLPFTIAVGGAGLAATLAASLTFVAESRCARGLLEQQLRLDRIPEIDALHPPDPGKVHWG